MDYYHPYAPLLGGGLPTGQPTQAMGRKAAILGTLASLAALPSALRERPVGRSLLESAAPAVNYLLGSRTGRWKPIEEHYPSFMYVGGPPPKRFYTPRQAEAAWLERLARHW